MKTLSWSGVLAMGLVLAVGGAQAAMMQNSGGPSAQQMTTSRGVETAPAASGVSHPVFIGRGAGFEGQPSPAAQFAHPGHTIVHPQPARVMNFGPRQGDFRHGGRFGHGRGFDRDRFAYHRHFICVFVNGAPCWYPVYTAYPYYYDAPTPIMSSTADYGSDGGGGYVPPVDTTSDTQTASDYGDVGASWGQDLRREVVTWNQFVAYLKAYIVTAPPSAQADFREAFISAYRINGAAAYDKAAADAAGNPSQQPSGPKIITLPSPRS
ncbi:MAG: hypothetical protein ABSH14_14615 [Verrucomicrobiia bacterium]|jgi:hypothetical protein